MHTACFTKLVVISEPFVSTEIYLWFSKEKEDFLFKKRKRKSIFGGKREAVFVEKGNSQEDAVH